MEYEIKNLPRYILNSSGLDAYIEDFGDETDTLPISEKNKIFEVNSITNDNIRDILENIRYFGTYQSDPIYYDVFCFLVNNDKSILDDFKEMKIFNQVHDFDVNNLSCDIAVKNGSLFALRYSHEHGSPWNTLTSYYAAKYNNLNCLQYAHEHGCEWDRRTCHNAALNGHLDCLRYAHENGCDWSSYTCIMAASNGHLDCLQYAHENGCDWNQDVCVDDGMLINLCVVAAYYGHLNCLQYGFENGWNWDVWISKHIKKCNAKCLQYAIQCGM